MFGKKATENMGLVMIPPQDLNDSQVDTEWISMAEYGHATAVIMVGDTAGATFAVTINEATSNAGAGAQVLTYTNMKSTGQKLLISSKTGTFSIGETITGGTSALTAELFGIASDYLLVRNLTGGTTWTTGETLTGGTSAATAVMSGTGQNEDMLLEKYAAPASTITVPAVTFKMYAIEIDAEDLTVADGYDHIQVALADPGTATIAGGIVILTQPRRRGIPMPSSIGNQKYVATSA